MVVIYEIGAVRIVNGDHGRVVVSRDEVVSEGGLHVGQCAGTGQTDTQTVVDGTLLELEAEAVTLHPVVAGDTLTIQVGVRSTIVALRRTS